MTDIFDVVIVGAGPGGSATAHYLARAGFKVLLLDKFSFPRDKTCGDALTPRALRVLDDMGILPAVEELGHRLNTIQFVSPRGHIAMAPLLEEDAPYDHLLFAPRLLLDNLILERALASGAHFKSPVRVTAIVPAGEEMLVKGQEGKQEVTYRARVVVIATGAASTNLLLQMGLFKKAPEMVLCARAYYEGVSVDVAHCRFDGVSLPGYGWIFPVSATTVNVGVGLFHSAFFARQRPKTAHDLFQRFVQSSPIHEMLAPAHQVGPRKGYPLRLDFAHAPTFGPRTLLVGEAAGLVNPVTGEGIDYALESGKLAAEHLSRIFAEGNFSSQQLSRYDQALRQRYQQLFIVCDRLRAFYLNPLLLDSAIKAVSRNEELKTLFMRIAIDNQEMKQGLAFQTVAKLFVKRGFARPIRA
jgi:menaquinone-9 beta-reductase